MSSPLGTPYKRHRGPDNADAIIIGSGVGGLATAALLGTKLGKRAIVLERHYRPVASLTRSGGPATNGTSGFTTSGRWRARRATWGRCWPA